LVSPRILLICDLGRKFELKASRCREIEPQKITLKDLEDIRNMFARSIESHIGFHTRARRMG